jgi:hypothetical protein
MKKLLILSTLAALSSVSLGCCGVGGCGGWGRRDACAPACEPAGCAPCDACNGGGYGGGYGAPMGAPVITTPGTTTVVPGPAYTGYLPKK